MCGSAVIASWGTARVEKFRSVEMKELHNSIARDHLAVKLGAELGSSFFCFEVDIVDAEASLIAVGPLVVVEEAPEKIYAHRNPVGNGALKMNQVIAQIHDAADVEYFSFGSERVDRGGSVLGDVNFLRLPYLRHQFRCPIQRLRPDVEPRSIPRVGHMQVAQQNIECLRTDELESIVHIGSSNDFKIVIFEDHFEDRMSQCVPGRLHPSKKRPIRF